MIDEPAPVWGDASHLIELLDVRPDGERHYASVARADERRPVVESSQMLAQAGPLDLRLGRQTAMALSDRVQRLLRSWRVAAAGGTALVLALGACSGDDDGASGTAATDAPAETTTTTVDRPDGPAADLSEELTAGDGTFIGSAYADETYEDEGYVELEYVAAGSASSYRAVGELTADGMWTVEPDTSAEYRTRVLVRRPENVADFSGTVLVEWLNVSGGVDADPDFVTLREEILRQGHAWAGVSAQVIGVEGGPVRVRVENVPGTELQGVGLKAIDPARYGSLDHPGDAFSYDIYTQVARALRQGAGLGDLEPGHVIAVGESQSALALVTYINGVQPLTRAFDGFFVHSRGATGLGLPAAGEAADIASSIGGARTIFRTDTDVPILDLQTESDLVGVFSSSAVRQPDTDTFRLWEVAGTAHADRHLVGEATVNAIDCGVPINDGPLHVVAKAALRHLVQWVAGGDAPPVASRIELTEDGSDIRRDADGIALGGVRTPPVDVPVRVLSGVQGPSAEVICLLFGSTTPLPAERLAERYPSRDAYEQRYRAAVDEAIAAGFVLDEDHAAIEQYAHPELVGG